jgi:hypothetical protein
VVVEPHFCPEEDTAINAGINAEEIQTEDAEARNEKSIFVVNRS